MRDAFTPTPHVATLVLSPADTERSVAGVWRKLMKELLDPYRPELHYMRGPGPKWRAKHGITRAAGRYRPG